MISSVQLLRDNKKDHQFIAVKYKFSETITRSQLTAGIYMRSTFQFYFKLFNLMVGFILYLKMKYSERHNNFILRTSDDWTISVAMVL